MSQWALTNPERRTALQRLGYSEREAHFLCLAGLHSGYFVRRQYASFLGTQDSGSVTQLIEKVLDLGHAESDTYKANTHIYHLAARPFYAALGQEDNRNRRRKELVTIKAKLMGLDFVLAHPDKAYLATEQEKRFFFQNVFSIEPADLPAKKYAGRGPLTTRYFVEKYPIFHSPSPESACPPVVSFGFVDPGLSGLNGFETFLNHYSALLAHLRDFIVIYVAANEVLLAKARTTFEGFLQGRRTQTNRTPWNGPVEKILEYFQARHLFEAKRFDTFDRAKLIRFRDQQEQFVGPQIEALYERWKAGEHLEILQDSGSKPNRQPPLHGRFSTYLLEHSYDLFGSVTTH